ncbi:Tripartite motif containing protein 2 [Fasciola hepatica]|uniref:Tripartite motif containing protein 2 n=1 Tax=Fasciola hepatica TaxID=6192 RepID=A0A4E0R4L9_FASHE|nr:Tripartite motif containing protein 2 [Fasciola hepatica]
MPFSTQLFIRNGVKQACALDVRTISKAISYLNGKLDTVTTLIEPRENAFLRYQDRGQSAPTTTATYQCGTDAKRVTHSSTLSGDLVVGTNIHVGVAASNQQDALGTDPYIGGTHGGAASAVGAGSTLVDISRCLAAFGRIVVSTTYPALCTARLPQQVVVNLHARAVIRAVDYHGRPQSTGGSDPVEVKLIDAEGRLVPTELLDVGDGSYQLILRPVTPGTHQLSIQILSRPIRGSPFQLPVRRAQQRRWCLNEGADGRGLIQPFAVTAGPYPIDEGSDQSTNQPARPVYVYLLDTGNSRLLVIDLITGKVQATLSGEPLASQAATGVAWSPHGLWIVNWRAKRVYLLDPRTDQVVHSIYSSQFVEPTSVFRCPTTGDLFVADNGAGCVFRCNPITGHTAPFVGAGAPPTSMVHSSQPADPTRTNSVPTSTPSPSLSPQQQTQQQSSADDSDASGSFGSSSIPLTSIASGSALEPRSWRQISGLCVTDTGELILSTGSTIRIFSRAGKQINCLVPPTGHTSSGSAHTLAVPMRPVSSLPTFDRTPPSGTDVAHTSGPTPSSPALNRASLHIATTTIIGIQDRMSLSGRSPTHRPTFSTPRGQFGGVCVTTSLTGDTECPDNLGRCLLASYSDRKRSGIAVWPQCYWASSRYVSELDQEAIEEDAKATIFDNEPIKPFPRWANLNAAPSPYLVEVDPGFRRLAGLLALPNSRQLVVVDQGAQSLCRIRYA